MLGCRDAGGWAVAARLHVLHALAACGAVRTGRALLRLRQATSPQTAAAFGLHSTA